MFNLPLGKKLPFGIGQIGKAFRNEITTGNFYFQNRVNKWKWNFSVTNETIKWLDFWKQERLEWFKSLGIYKDKCMKYDEDAMAQYCFIVMILNINLILVGLRLEGIADRDAYDLDQHMKHSNKKLTYFDQVNNTHFVPAVVEGTGGVDRAMLTILADAFCQEEVNGEKRTVMKLSPKITSIKVAVFPLLE